MNRTGRAATVALAALVLAATAAAQTTRPCSTRSWPGARHVRTGGAGLHGAAVNLPAGLRGLSTEEIARQWPSWVEQHDRDVRARLARGDEDSLVNFWLYGTSFTTHPPAIARASPLPASALDDIVKGRLNEDPLDRVTARATTSGCSSPTACSRRTTPTRVRPAAASGRARSWSMPAADDPRIRRHGPGIGGGESRGNRSADSRERDDLPRPRPLIRHVDLADYGVHVGLETIARQGTLAPGSVRRVVVVGPGLDFTNKADGYDYYPQQTIQPFALINTLRRLNSPPRICR